MKDIFVGVFQLLTYFVNKNKTKIANYSISYSHVTIKSSYYALGGTKAKFWLVLVGFIAKT